MKLNGAEVQLVRRLADDAINEIAEITSRWRGSVVRGDRDIRELRDRCERHLKGDSNGKRS